MNKKYCVSSMKKLAQDRELEFVSEAYTSCGSNHTWKCRICDHEWRATPSNIIHRKSGCPNCAGQCQSIETMRELAKASGLEFLSDIYKTMRTKYKWKCHNGHTSLIAAHSVKSGTKCSYCHKGVKEEECRFIIENLTGYKFPVGRIQNLELDGHCPDLNLAFEYNGKQHYEFVQYFHRSKIGFEKQIERDNKKSEACQQSGINKFDIPYFEATNRKSLTKFISYLLKKSDVTTYESNVNWNNFPGKRRFLEETTENAAQVNAICLSEVYITAKTKLKFQCKTCKHVWWSTPSNIKTGYGCIKCSYSHTRWDTRRNKSGAMP